MIIGIKEMYRIGNIIYIIPIFIFVFIILEPELIRNGVHQRKASGHKYMTNHIRTIIMCVLNNFHIT